MIGISVKVIGAKALINVMKKAEKEVDAQMKKDMLKAVISVEGDAKKIVPIATHNLQTNITHEVKKTTGGWGGRVGSNVHYAPFVEFGTSRMRPQPYLYPALRMNFDFIRKLFGNGVVKAIEKAGK